MFNFIEGSAPGSPAPPLPTSVNTLQATNGSAKLSGSPQH